MPKTLTDLSQRLEAAIDSEASLLIRIDAAEQTAEAIQRLMKKARKHHRRRETKRAAHVLQEARALYDAWLSFEMEKAKKEIG